MYWTGCNAARATSAIAPAAPDLPAVPVQGAVETFTRNAELEFPGYGKGRAAVSDRILEGFEAAPSRLVLADGSSVRWGFKNHEANLQSVAISDKSGRLKLLAAVNGVVRLIRMSGTPIGDMAQYKQAVERSGTEPSVIVFVHDGSEWESSLPLLKRWLQANLLGFNADCGKSNLDGACKLAEQIVIPATVYATTAEGSLHHVNASDVKAAAVPLQSFIQ